MKQQEPESIHLLRKMHQLCMRYAYQYECSEERAEVEECLENWEKEQNDS